MFDIKKRVYAFTDEGKTRHAWELVADGYCGFPCYATITNWIDGTYRLNRMAGGSSKSFNSWIAALNYARAMYRGTAPKT